MTLPARDTVYGILFTDQYQLTMAQLYFREDLHERQVLFEHYFRQYPDYGAHKAGYCVSAGLEWLLDWMQRVHFRSEDIEYLRGQTGRAGNRIFDDDFLAWLSDSGTFESLTLRAIPEGRVVHPNEPLTTVEGPLAMAQILETSLLNHLNYQTLIASKAARIHESGRGRLLLEFGLRRGHGEGANAGTRAALIGGADASSNVGISHALGYAPAGTHAHSMVQLFMSLGMTELDAFRAYAEVYPDDCLLLVDTIDTLNSGVPNAIRVFEDLKRKGHKPVGIRLDSGDLAFLSIQAASMLDEAGFPETTIVLSGDLDELVILQILTQIGHEAHRYGLEPDHLVRRLAFGVGTRLITSWGEPALGGVYKLVAARDDGQWVPLIKVSASSSKTPDPGHKQIWRVYDRRAKATADLISLHDEDLSQLDRVVLRHPTNHAKHRTLDQGDITEIEPLLVDALREGRLVCDLPPIEALRERRRLDVRRLDPGVRRLMNPHVYHISLSQRLWERKQRLIRSARGESR